MMLSDDAEMYMLSLERSGSGSQIALSDGTDMYILSLTKRLSVTDRWR